MKYDTRYTMDLQRKYYSALEELHLHRNSFTELTKKHEDKEVKMQKALDIQDDEIEHLEKLIHENASNNRGRRSKQTSTIKKLKSEKAELTSKVKELEKLRVELEKKYTVVDQMLAEKDQTPQEWRDEAYANSIKNKNDLRNKLTEDNKNTDHRPTPKIEL